MCNPRRIHVTASAQLAEAWEHEIRRVATRSGDAMAEARLLEPLDATIGAPVLVMLERALAGTEGWEQDGDSFRYTLDGGYLAYHADTQELEIVAQAAERVDVEVAAVETAHGEVAEHIEVRGTGTYYDDGYGGITEDDARRAAHADAQSNLELERQRVLAQAREQAEALRAVEVEASAAAQAEAEWARRTAQRAEELRGLAVQRLTALGIEGRNVFHRALAMAYRDAITAYAQSRGAENFSCTERDGVVEIEFEMQR